MFQVSNLGLVPYDSALLLQEKLAELRAQDRISDTLILLEHPPAITLGASAAESDILLPRPALSRLGVDVVKTRRGGNVTYHGPGQLVAYPIFKLPGPHIRRWVGFLESVMIGTLKTFGIDALRNDAVGVRAQGRISTSASGVGRAPIAGSARVSDVGRLRASGAPSAGVSDVGRKIGFVGIKISRSVSYHGVSLNVDPDLNPFSYIVPCSRAGDPITSMEKLLGRAPAMEDVQEEFIRQMAVLAGKEAQQISADEVWSLAFPAGVSAETCAIPRRGLPDRAGPKPSWLRRPIPGGPAYIRLREIMDAQKLHTVCESAHCPNLGECWGRGTATFMILGDTCTRACGFCAVRSGRPMGPDRAEPARVAQAVREMNLRHVVITSVNRDDLDDGGAEIWARTIWAVREKNPEIHIEVLIPDLCGNWPALDAILAASPDILNHNLETVPRLYPTVRPRARYERSLELLDRARSAGLRTKTGIMIGIGEHPFEIFRTLRDISKRRVDILTLGQYLRPSPNHLPVDRWVHPTEFDHWRRVGIRLGFKYVESGPLVRSSYHADAQVAAGI